jgi:polyisoprenoid-binding protein YceI
MNFARLSLTAIVLSATLLGGTAATVVALPNQAPAAETPNDGKWSIDPVHSKALFRVLHLGAGAFWGKFDDVQGSITYYGGEKAPEFDVSIAIESVHSGNESLDKHLKSPDFFNAKEFPAMTFKSSKGVLKSPGTWEVCGELTMHGQTHEACATVTMTGSADMGRGPKAGFEAMFTIKRSQWGMTYGVEKGSLGDEVRVIVALEAGKAK